MRHLAKLFLGAIALAILSGVIGLRAQDTSVRAPIYDAQGRMELPRDYRSWVYLTSGIDMSYSDTPVSPGMSAFDNVFVNREAYESFQRTGRWPDKTVLILEGRSAEQAGSINKSGRFQTGIVRVEAHVKDAARFNGGWAFFAFQGQAPAPIIPKTANCYSCHQ